MGLWIVMEDEKIISATSDIYRAVARYNKGRPGASLDGCGYTAGTPARAKYTEFPLLTTGDARKKANTTKTHKLIAESRMFYNRWWMWRLYYIHKSVT